MALKTLWATLAVRSIERRMRCGANWPRWRPPGGPQSRTRPAGDQLRQAVEAARWERDARTCPQVDIARQRGPHYRRPDVHRLRPCAPVIATGEGPGRAGGQPAPGRDGRPLAREADAAGPPRSRQWPRVSAGRPRPDRSSRPLRPRSATSSPASRPSAPASRPRSPAPGKRPPARTG